MQLWALIVDSFRESLDRKIFWVLLLIEVVVAAAMFCVGFEPGKVDILFGTWTIETAHFTALSGLRMDLLARTVNIIMDFVVGWIGVTLAIVATAGFIPAMLERGAVDVLLSKPLSRPLLFLGKYLGSMVFVLVHAAFFVGLTFLIIGWRWNAWLPGYFWTIPLLVVLFSYVYCVSAWAGVRFRSSIVAINLSVGAWVFFAGIQGVGDLFELEKDMQKHRWAYRSVQIARWCVPKTQDITDLAAKWSGAAASTELMPEPPEEDREAIEQAKRTERKRMDINPVHTIGTSLLFEAVVVLLAMWRFSRQDY